MDRVLTYVSLHQTCIESLSSKTISLLKACYCTLFIVFVASCGNARVFELIDVPIVRDRGNTKGFVREEKRGVCNPLLMLDPEKSPLEIHSFVTVD